MAKLHLCCDTASSRVQATYKGVGAQAVRHFTHRASGAFDFAVFCRTAGWRATCYAV